MMMMLIIFQAGAHRHIMLTAIAILLLFFIENKSVGVVVVNASFVLPTKSIKYGARTSISPWRPHVQFEERDERRRRCAQVGDNNNDDNDNDNKSGSGVEATTTTTTEDEELYRLKTDLLDLSEKTARGFKASSTERKEVRRLIDELARRNPTAEPVSPYYSSSSSFQPDDNKNKPNTFSLPTLAGKWTLVYTDAPDIIGLDTSSSTTNFFIAQPTAQLGRIGQECNQPPMIKNVIEWIRPEWTKALPGTSNLPDRVLQKVCITGQANPQEPQKVTMKIAGLDLVVAAVPDSNSNDDNNNNNTMEDVDTKKSAWTEWLNNQNIELRGPLNPFFGTFEVLFLDESMRITRTGQNYYAVNIKCETPQEEWF